MRLAKSRLAFNAIRKDTADSNRDKGGYGGGVGCGFGTEFGTGHGGGHGVGRGSTEGQGFGLGGSNKYLAESGAGDLYGCGYGYGRESAS